MTRDELFEKVLAKFEYRLTKDVIQPTLTEDTIVDLFLFIEQGLKEIDDKDPNEQSSPLDEGDEGSVYDRYPEAFAFEEEIN